MRGERQSLRTGELTQLHYRRHIDAKRTEQNQIGVDTIGRFSLGWCVLSGS